MGKSDAIIAWIHLLQINGEVDMIIWNVKISTVNHGRVSVYASYLFVAVISTLYYDRTIIDFIDRFGYIWETTGLS